MPSGTTRGRQRARRTATAEDQRFRFSNLFPDDPAIEPRGPLPKQAIVYELLRSGAARGGGVVYQGGKGCAKTMCGAAGIVWAHRYWPGLNSVVGRETYGALVTSTSKEFFDMIQQVPKRCFKSITKPTKNSMGTVEWDNGGTTFLVSLSNNEPWESANIGLAWVDEGHLQNPAHVGALEERIRQKPKQRLLDHTGAAIDYPRAMIITSNPMGKRVYFYLWAGPESKERRPNWHYLEATMFENPALSDDYVQRMLDKYPEGSPGRDRWVYGKAAALEGAAFGHILNVDPMAQVHIVQPFELPRDWPRGRGIDWGLDNPTAVVWGAKDPEGNWWIYRAYEKAGLSARRQARIIMELEREDHPLTWVAADPEMFRKVHTKEEGSLDLRESTADQMEDVGLTISVGNNNRKYGLDLITELLAPDENHFNPVLMSRPGARLYFFHQEDVMQVVDCLDNLQWRPEAKTGNTGAPDDIKKKDDHLYDALRYLVAEEPDLESETLLRTGRRVQRLVAGSPRY